MGEAVSERGHSLLRSLRRPRRDVSSQIVWPVDQEHVGMPG